MSSYVKKIVLVYCQCAKNSGFCIKYRKCWSLLLAKYEFDPLAEKNGTQI